MSNDAALEGLAVYSMGMIVVGRESSKYRMEQLTNKEFGKCDRRVYKQFLRFNDQSLDNECIKRYRKKRNVEVESKFWR